MDVPNRECGKFAIVAIPRKDELGRRNLDVQVSGSIWTSTIGTLELARQHLKESAERFPDTQFAIVQFLEVLE
jgi:hypothetical protein